jgi:ABC-type polysaccharide/polyol phosphate export permease
MANIIHKTKSAFSLGLTMARIGFKLQNEDSWFGPLWYLLSPVLTFFLMLGIFQDRLGNSIPNYPAYLLLGIILFSYFQKIADSSVTSIRGSAGIIKSINFPKESLILSNLFSILISHILEIIILILFFIFFGVEIKMLIFYPTILLFLSIFAYGAGLILASVAVYFVDLGIVWGFLVRLIWLATPIFYSIEGQTRLGIINLFNPMYYFISVARDIIIYAKVPELWLIFGMIGYSLLFFVTGLFIFNKLKLRFAELI